jgi:hypothetical protein
VIQNKYRHREEQSTVAIIRKAATGYLFSLNGGTEYMVPRNKPRQYREVMKDPKFDTTIEKPATANNITNNHADWTERSPAAIGKYGLFTLFDSTESDMVNAA